MAKKSDIVGDVVSILGKFLCLENSLLAGNRLIPTEEQLVEDIKEQLIGCVKTFHPNGDESKGVILNLNGDVTINVNTSSSSPDPGCDYNQPEKMRCQNIPSRSKRIPAPNNNDADEHINRILANKNIILLIDLFHRRLYYKGIGVTLQPVHFKFLAAVASSPMKMIYNEHLDILMKNGKYKDDTDRTNNMRYYKNKTVNFLKQDLLNLDGNDGQKITAAEIDHLISGVTGGYRLNLEKDHVHFYLEKGREVPVEYQNLLPEWANGNHD